jgi:hypothetical protein
MREPARSGLSIFRIKGIWQESTGADRSGAMKATGVGRALFGPLVYL